jgi:hypothetical protein
VTVSGGGAEHKAPHIAPVAAQSACAGLYTTGPVGYFEDELEGT